MGDDETGTFADTNSAEQLSGFFALRTAEAIEVEELETELIREVETTRYRLRFEPGAVDTTLAGVDVMDVWIDGDDLVRRMSMEVVLEGLMDDQPSTTSFVIEYFDYGTAPPIELPDPDDVIDFEDWLETDPFGEWEDPFEGADCYGEALADCLQTNPELDDLAADPALCQGDEARVCLVPVGHVRRDVVDSVIAFHRETRGIDIVVLPGLPVDEAHIDTATSQGLADLILEDVFDHYLVEASSSTLIAVTPMDLRPADDSLGWYFGFRNGGDYTGHQHGIFSYFRMANVEPYDARPLDAALLFERVNKYFGRYVASLYLRYPLESNLDFLNYDVVWGFSDLDAMGSEWPTGEPPCVTDADIICLIPDGDHDFSRAEIDQAAERLEEHCGVPVQVRPLEVGHVYPTRDPWSAEFRDDLDYVASRIMRAPNITVIGLTDDPFDTVGPGRGPHITVAWPDDRVAVASTAGAGVSGTSEFGERMFRVLVRAIETGHFGLPETDAAESVRFSGHSAPGDLDGLVLESVARPTPVRRQLPVAR